jgi:DNA repair photolyase
VFFRTNTIKEKTGVEAQDWGQYVLIKEQIVETLDLQLVKKKKYLNTPAGKGVFLLCSGTDPYQDRGVAAVTREVVKTMLKHGKRVRLLTRSPLWTKDLDILVDPNVTVGMSLPHLDDRLSRQMEPGAPSPKSRLLALSKGKAAGCRVFVAMAPTPPIAIMGEDFFDHHLSVLAKLDPEVIFWEPINPRGSNINRMLNAGLTWADGLQGSAWAKEFMAQWELIEKAGDQLGILPKIHFWPDKNLNKYRVRDPKVFSWIDRPTVETWSARMEIP